MVADSSNEKGIWIIGKEVASAYPCASACRRHANYAANHQRRNNAHVCKAATLDQVLANLACKCSPKLGGNFRWQLQRASAASYV